MVLEWDKAMGARIATDRDSNQTKRDAQQKM